MAPMQDTGTFSAYQVPGEGNENLHCQNISFWQPYSQEELELNDCQNGHGPVKRPSISANRQFMFDVTGLTAAKVPRATASVCFSSCRMLSSTVIPLGATVVTFRVGDEKLQDFVVHEKLIARRSEFVRTALSKDWKESLERVIHLPKAEPRTFELYQQWLYTGRIPSCGYGDHTKDAQEYRNLVDAYNLGERFLDADWKDAIVDAIINKLYCTSVFDPRLTNLVYDNTPLLSPLRRLLQDIYVYSGSAKWLEDMEDVNSDFAKDLCKCQMGLKNGIDPKDAPYLNISCRYHEHGPKGVCYYLR